MGHGFHAMTFYTCPEQQVATTWEYDIDISFPNPKSTGDSTSKH